TLDASATLNIAAGTNIFLHADAPLLVDGTLILNGTLNNKIIFRGDRLDEPYKNFPAGWPGIYLRASSKNNIFTFAEIRNATQAVSVSGPSVNGNPKLVMQKVIIDNAFEVGLVCSNATVAVSNSLISNCKNNIVLQGGNYTLTHCTLAGYSTKFIQHAKPVLTVADFNLINGNAVYSALQANFINCIFWGENNAVPQEVQVVRQGNLPFALSFDRCLYKADIDPPNSTLISVIKNQDPLFDTIDYNNNFYDFRITKNSSAPGINKGVLTTFTKDLDDKNRNVGLPDLGAYEKQ
ncbi:MAG: hypothetical protein ABIO05_02345, partial [Ferruginibacter sp.]